MGAVMVKTITVPFCIQRACVCSKNDNLSIVVKKYIKNNKIGNL